MSAQILQRHHFASHLKRMAVVVRVEGEDGFMVLVKVPFFSSILSPISFSLWSLEPELNGEHPISPFFMRLHTTTRTRWSHRDRERPSG